MNSIITDIQNKRLEGSDNILKCFEKSHINKFIRKVFKNGKWEYIYKEEDFKQHIKTIEDYANKVIKQEKYLKRLLPEEEQGRCRGGKLNVETTLFLETSKGTDGAIHGRDEQIESLREFAKLNNCWIEDYIKEYGIENKIAGYPEATESEVFKKGGWVIKVNNFSQHEEAIELFDRIALQNHIFPATKYELIGFTEREGQVNAIMRQPFIEMERDIKDEVVKPTIQDISLEMRLRGYQDRGGNMYTDENYIIEDLHRKNACFDKRGRLLMIDPVIRLNVKSEGYGGVREFGKIDLK